MYGLFYWIYTAFNIYFMKSFSIIRTNTALTTNIQLVVTSDYGLYMESFNSVPQLSQSKYKHVRFNKDNFWDELVPSFFDKTPANIAFAVKYENDADIVYSDYNKQYDDIYYAGSTNISDLSYKEEFEYFAPLYIQPHSIPNYFFIFRVDGLGLINATKDNFQTEILDKLKCVSSFDLTPNTPLGEFIKRNFKENTNFPTSPFNLDVRETEFSKWNGIEYESGGYTSKSLFLNDYLTKEQTYFDMENFITDGYKNNKVVFPNILNFKFLFDDTPATQTALRKWSINRYMGFYMDDIELVDKISPYSPYQLKSNITINSDNTFVDANNNYIDPFIKGYIDGNVYYVEYKGSYYRVLKYTDTQTILDPNVVNVIGTNVTNTTTAIYKYKILADITLAGMQASLNKNIMSFNNNYITYDPLYNSTTYSITDFANADLYLIEIDKKYHVLKYDSNGYYLNTDYGFKLNNNKLSYFINSSNPDFTTTVQLDKIADDVLPIFFNVYRCKFTDVKDFDTSIVNTTYANHQYELKDTLINTNEPKFYRNDYKTETNSNVSEEFVYNSTVVHIPASSEYVAGSEIFEVKDNGTLSEIWRKNPTFTKWAYQNSLSTNNYPYKLNNSKLSAEYNNSANTHLSIPMREERNLDYFYTINPSTTTDYMFHSLHVTDYITPTTYNPTFSFELDKYLNIGGTAYSTDYFEYFFTKKDYFDNGNIVKSNNKYSYFNSGDNIIPNNTVLNGIKFNLYDIQNVYLNGNQLKNITTSTFNNYNDWKLAILFSHNDYSLELNEINQNSLQWKIIDDWKSEKQYTTNDLVLHSNILYTVNSGNIITDPNINPANSSNYTIYNNVPNTIFWNPTYSGYGGFTASQQVIFYGNDYYRNVSATASYADMWNSGATYSINNLTVYDKAIYISLTSSNYNKTPLNNPIYWQKSTYTPTPTYTSGTSVILDSSAVSNTKWETILEWNPLANYVFDQYVTYLGVVYLSTTTNQNSNPSNIASNIWQRVYSLESDTTYAYNNTYATNNIIRMNNVYYMCTSNTNLDTLDNGINIFIHKKWKNVLINIYNNDNTLANHKNTNRDDLYNKIYSTLTANNFIQAINDLENTYGFANKLNYYIIEEDETYNVYNIDNIKSLPIILLAEHADLLEVRSDSYIVNPTSPNKNLYKSNFTLDNNLISAFNETQYYNGKDLAVNIKYNIASANIVDNISGIKNLTHYELYRMNGGYMPIFYNIELFKNIITETDLIGNYKFDTTLSDFGIIKERIFSKVAKENVLKFKHVKSVKSVYPMIDEFGYYFDNYYMFKSTWDTNYLIDTIDNPFYKGNNSNKGQTGLTSPTNNNSII